MAQKTILQDLGFEKYQIDSNLCYFKRNLHVMQTSFAEEIFNSLNRESKYISPKFFYNQRGSKLFEKICKLPEYYLTRTELQILENLKKTLSEFLDGDYRLVELGSGSSRKTRRIIDALIKHQKQVEYIPIDISEIIMKSCRELLGEYNNLKITGIVDTYEGGLEFLKEYDNKQNLIAFLGSSFGNFSPNEGRIFLQKLCSTMKENDLFLIGLDLVKEKSILEKAYDDSRGITAEFNLNMLMRINEELEGNFDLRKFSHHAIYNEDKQRIEMYLCSNANQIVTIPKANLSIRLNKEELIHTEHSHKYTMDQIYDMLESSGFRILKIWQDKKKHFAVVLSSRN